MIDSGEQFVFETDVYSYTVWFCNVCCDWQLCIAEEVVGCEQNVP